MEIYEDIVKLLEKARSRAYIKVNTIMVETYWNIGRIIVEEEQKGEKRAKYGTYLIKELSRKLTERYGKGFSVPNLRKMRQFFQYYPIRSPAGSELSWTHIRRIIRVKDKQIRDFYLIECANNKWSKRELNRQINSMLYERLTLSLDKKKVKQLSQKGQVVSKPEDLIKDPFVFEFLGLKEIVCEKDLEKALIDNLQKFLLELGKGFSFVARQRRITLEENYYVDLVFYNYILKCFVLIDLKLGKLSHKDIGQMDFYVRYFEKEVKQKGDNPTIGIILCSDKDETMVKYTILNENKRLFATKYKLYLPTKEDFEKILKS
tara:strand:- start:488 stop:1444 length:957 start_codon:yes stop_codon:yes gene_type:complete